MSLKPIIQKTDNLCRKGTMSKCGGYEENNFPKCAYYEESRSLQPCTWNPFHNICTCIKAQLNRDGGR